MAKTVQSRKAKGRRLQQLVRDTIIGNFGDLTLDDVRSTSMGAGGEDVTLSAKAREIFPFTVECKAQEGFTKLYSAWDQAASRPGHSIPIVVIKSNKKVPLVTLSLTEFMTLARAYNNDRLNKSRE